jgi:Asp-tRNA(Asn)/Glu-tRNA(Gln) amidotransferase B subunit
MEVHVQPTTHQDVCGCAVAPGHPTRTHVRSASSAWRAAGVNKAAVRRAGGGGLSCEIPRHTKFDHKSYMYRPAEGLQISQYDLHR